MTVTSKRTGSLIVSKKENDVWDVDLPYWRPDITIQEDLCEEIARLIGYESIPATTIAGAIDTSIPNIKIDFQEHLRDIMVSLGCFEVINYSADSKENIASTCLLYTSPSPRD